MALSPKTAPRTRTHLHGDGEGITPFKIERDAPDDEIDIVTKEHSIMDEIRSGKGSAIADGGAPTNKSTLLSIDPQSIDIVPLDKGRAAEESASADDGPALKRTLLDSLATDGAGSFVKMFRGSASYIANHRGTLAVYHIPGELLAWEGFPGLMDDSE